MHLEPQPVPGSVPERVPKPVLHKDVPGRRVHRRSAVAPGLTAANGRRVRALHRLEQRAQTSPSPGAKLDRPGQIHAVSVVDPPEVQHHAIPRLESAPARPRVRQGAVGPGRDDRLERGPLEPGPRNA